MKRRLWKEIRELSPYWIPLLVAGLMLAVYVRIEPPVPLPEWGSTNPAARQNYETLAVAVPHFYQNLALGLLLLQYFCFHLMAVALFGAEFRYGALGRLLAQPITRSRIWCEKMLAYSLIGLAVLMVSIILYAQMFPWVERMEPLTGDTDSIAWFMREHVSQWIIMHVVICLLAAASGSCVALWIRQSHTAFWGALTFPLFVYILAMMFDFMAVKPLFHFSFFEFLEFGRPHLFVGGRGYNQIIKFSLLWFLIVCPVGWHEFKRLEV